MSSTLTEIFGFNGKLEHKDKLQILDQTRFKPNQKAQLSFLLRLSSIFSDTLGSALTPGFQLQQVSASVLLPELRADRDGGADRRQMLTPLSRALRNQGMAAEGGRALEGRSQKARPPRGEAPHASEPQIWDRGLPASWSDSDKPLNLLHQRPAGL